MSRARAVVVCLLLLLGTGCTLTSSVRISRMAPIDAPDENVTLEALYERGEYLRLVSRQITSESPEAIVTIGRSQLHAMRLDQAKENFLKVLEMGERGAIARDAYWGLARIAEIEGHREEAISRSIEARGAGLRIRQWYIDLQGSLLDIPTYETSGAQEVEIPVKTTLPDLPRIELTLGDSSAEAVIDSGAALSIISESLAGRAGAIPLGDFSGEVSGLLGAAVDVEFALIDELTIGGIRLESLPVAVIPDHRLLFRTTEGDFQIEFLIGTDFLRRFRMTIDPAAGLLRLERVDAIRPANDQNLFIHEGRPMVAVAVEGKGWFPMIIDTGSEVTFLNRTSPIVQSTLARLPRFHAATMQFIDGVRGSGTKVERVTIGVDGWRGRFSNLPLYADSRSSNIGILGQNFLSKFRTTIDFGRMRVSLEPLD